MSRRSGEDQRISFFIYAADSAADVVISVAPADAPTVFVQVKSTAINELFNLDVAGPVVIRCETSGAGTAKVYAQ